MTETLYRRPLPAETIAFASPPGRALFAEALAAGGLDGYFALAEQFHTQSEPAFCGLGSLVVALNALGIDPGRLWKGPWRWFSEELLDCCVSLDEIRRRGLDLDELACLARCNGADVELHRAETDDLAAWRAALATAAHGDAVVIAAYDRAALGQTGAGHASPIGGYHAARDLALVLDVARFKYPPHWIAADRLWEAMRGLDPMTRHSRGWLVLRRRAGGTAVGYSVSCAGGDWRGFIDQLAATIAGLDAAADVTGLARALAPLGSHIVLRATGTEAHEVALAAAHAAIRELPMFGQIAAAVGPTHAETTTILLLAIADRLASPARGELAALVAEAARLPALAGELANLRAQLDALWRHHSSPR